MQVLPDGSKSVIAGDRAFNPVDDTISVNPEELFRCGSVGLLPLGLLPAALLLMRWRPRRRFSARPPSNG